MKSHEDDRTTAANGEPPFLRGVWLTASPVRLPIERLLLEMLERTQPRAGLRRSIIEELNRPVKITEVVLEYLGLQQVDWDTEGEIPMFLVAPRPGPDRWREALLSPGGDCPVGFVVSTRDRGRVAFVHEVFRTFSAPLKALTRRYVALAVSGVPHDRIIKMLHADDVLGEARRRVHMLDPSLLFSADGAIRVQLGSVSQTPRSVLREGGGAELVIILPTALFHGRTNYGDIEFLVYLNFFLHHGRRTRIVATAAQHATLRRFLMLALFGLFDPCAAANPRFDSVRETYGVPDPETYGLFHTAYEIYAPRMAGDSAAPVRGLDDYVEAIELTTPETVVPIGAPGNGIVAAAEVRIRPLSSGGFDVHVRGADGRTVSKQLEVMPPPRKRPSIPDDLRHPLEFATGRPRFGVTPLGTSHGFDPDGDLTSFVIWVNGRGIVVDPSPESLLSLERLGVASLDVPYVFLTHIHADHDSGLLAKLLDGSRTTVLASDVVFRTFVEKARLLTGHDFEREGLVASCPVNPGSAVTIEIGGESVVFESRWNLHPIPTNGFTVSVTGRTFGYSGDVQYDPALIRRLTEKGRLTTPQCENLLHFFWTTEGTPKVDLLYHEAGIPPIHTAHARLAELPDEVKARTFLVHVADNELPTAFVPGRPRLFATHTLLPATDRSRDRILLDTLRLVIYLYDVSDDVMEMLLRAAEVHDFPKHTRIVRRGPVAKHDVLDFFVIADGEVMVKDQRLLTRLQKGDTFGEWSISHQRGYRIADVIATRRTQCIRLTDAQYRWLVDRYPIIQERISRIRGLLPRLELARAVQRLQAAPAKRAGLIRHMTTRQLAGLAMFGEVRTFDRGQRILVEGSASDGFYVLLSGHLSVVAAGWTVGELLEGEIFGEIGLLEGGPRQATVAVASADADVLLISTATFRRLLDSLPSFSWGIHEIAEQRRQKSPSEIGWRTGAAGARAWESESAERQAMPGRVEAT